jgi:glycosyltransferase involved in cell wall biosynthesis
MHCTVLIPAYNTAPYIRRAIESVTTQAYRDWDILVVDDGSRDATPDIVMSYMPRYPVSLVQLKCNRGVTYATAIGLEQAQGPVVTVLDSDDYLFSNSLAAGVPPFQDSAVGYCWTQFRMSNGRVGWSKGLPAGKTLLQALRSGWWCGSHQRFCSLPWYRKGNRLCPSVDRASDFQLCYLLALTGCKTRFIPTVTYCYQVSRPGSITSQGPGLQRQAVSAILRM